MTNKAVFRIGEVAARSGVSIDTLRYYERIGLLPQVVRTRSRYRMYDPHTIDRIASIKRAKRFGFTLDEIFDLVRLGITNPETCAQVLRMIQMISIADKTTEARAGGLQSRVRAGHRRQKGLPGHRGFSSRLL